jgi:hypothetical protein
MGMADLRLGIISQKVPPLAYSYNDTRLMAGPFRPNVLKVMEGIPRAIRVHNYHRR